MCGGAVSVLDPEFSIPVWSAEAAAQPPPPRVEPSGPRPCQLSGLVTRRLSPSRFKGPRPCQLWGLVGPAGDSETLSESVQGTAPLSATGADHPGCPSCDFHAC